MTYRIQSFQMTFRDLRGHSRTSSLFKCDFFRTMCSTWHDFNWLRASRGPLRQLSLLYLR